VAFPSPRSCFGLLPVLVFSAMLTACGGGGGSGTGLPPGGRGATPTPPIYMVAGAITDTNSGGPLAGATVTIGPVPNNATCNAAQTDALNVCGTPGAPLATTTTTSTGTYILTLASAGTYMVAVFANGHATLHRTIVVNGATSVLCSITRLTADEIAWLADFNNKRATISFPHSFPNLKVDEYAERQARRWAADVAAGITKYGDAGYAPYGAAYVASPGAMYVVGGILDLVPPPGGQWLTADNGWFAEKANCPNGNWQMCTFAENTGHYIEASNTSDVWVGLGASLTSFNYPPFGQQYAYNVMIIGNNAGPGPPSNRVVAERPVKI